MTDDYFVIRIPRITGRKTLAVNGFAIVLAAGMGAYAGLGNDAWLSGDAIAVLGIMAIVNLALRVVTDRPVSWREPLRYVELEPSVSFDEELYAKLAQKQAQAGLRGIAPVSMHEWVHDELRPFVSDPAPVTSLEDFVQIKRIKEHVGEHLKANELPANYDELEEHLEGLNGHARKDH